MRFVELHPGVPQHTIRLYDELLQDHCTVLFVGMFMAALQYDRIGHDVVRRAYLDQLIDNNEELAAEAVKQLLKP